MRIHKINLVNIINTFLLWILILWIDLLYITYQN